MPHPLFWRLMIVPALVLSGVCAGQFNAPLPLENIPVTLDSGMVMNTTGRRTVIFSTEISHPGAPWMRLLFDTADLGAPASPGGQLTVIRMTSILDGASQTMNAEHLNQWQYGSAYFNGDAVRVEIIADAKSEPSHLTISQITIGLDDPGEGGIATLCGSDDRVLSSDPRTARVVPVGCTVWLFNDATHNFLTAGHCAGGSLTTVEFNVPLSQSNGSIVHPPPQDQYAVDSSSVQSNNGGLGNDYCYFGCFSNPNTGLTPFEKQQAFYVLAATAPAVNGQTIRITGYGTDSSPLTYNQVQQTSTGPYSSLSGTVIKYQCDTEGGNSGSAVLDEGAQLAIGIHTNGGCGSSGGSNSGTAVNNAGLQAALGNPLGICNPPSTYCPADLVKTKSVNIDDLLFIISRFGMTGGIAGDCAPEGGDGAVNIDDLLFVINSWGPCPV